MKLPDVLLRDTRANQPLATAVPPGTYYYVTDEQTSEQSNGSAWLSVACALVPEVAFASLPATPQTGQLANVSNSNTATWGAVVAAGGSNHVLVRYNGVAWTVVGK